MTHAIALLLTARASATPFTCDLTGLKKADSGLVGVAVSDPVYAAKLVEYYEAVARRFPPGLFGKEVKRVFLTDTATYRGESISGLALVGSRSVVLAVGGKSGDRLLRDFHHEVAHILYDRHQSKFPERAWRGANAPGFRYLFANGFESMVAKSWSFEFDPMLADRGIVSTYGASCFGEDLAMVAETLLVGYDGDEKDVIAIATRYPRLATKFRLLVEFYRGIFPGIWFPDLPAPGGTKPS